MRQKAPTDVRHYPFAKTHAPLPDFPALAPAAVPLALTSMAPAPVFPSPVVQWVSVPEALNDMAPVLTLCPSVMPMPFSSFLAHNDSIQSWLTAALPLAIAPCVTEALTVPMLAEVSDAAPVMKKARQSAKTSGNRKALDKPPRRRSHHTATAL
jgi:hypothetical protein